MSARKRENWRGWARGLSLPFPAAFLEPERVGLRLEALPGQDEAEAEYLGGNYLS